MYAFHSDIVPIQKGVTSFVLRKWAWLLDTVEKLVANPGRDSLFGVEDVYEQS